MINTFIVVTIMTSNVGAYYGGFPLLQNTHVLNVLHSNYLSSVSANINNKICDNLNTKYLIF